MLFTSLFTLVLFSGFIIVVIIVFFSNQTTEKSSQIEILNETHSKTHTKLIFNQSFTRFLNMNNTTQIEQINSTVSSSLFKAVSTTTGNFSRVIERKIKAGASQILSVAVLRDQSIASGSLKEIKLWNSDGSLIRTFKTFSWMTSLAAMENSRLISSHLDNTITIWNATTGQSIRNLTEHTNIVNCLAVLRGDRIASGSDDQSIIVWDANTGKIIRVLNGHNSSIVSLAALDNDLLASGSQDCSIKIWNVTSGEEIRTLEGHTHTVKSLLRLPSNRLASGSEDTSIRIWDIENGSVIHILVEKRNSDVLALSLLKDNITLASASADLNIRLWNISNGNFITYLKKHHKSSIRSLALLDDGRLISGSTDKSIIIWK